MDAAIADRPLAGREREVEGAEEVGMKALLPCWRPGCGRAGWAFRSARTSSVSQLLSALPDKTGMGFVLVQHLDPKHESRLSDLLAKTTRMPVLEATHGLLVRADQVHVIPPNTT